MKLWNVGVRIFEVLIIKVYHFGSIVSRRYKNHPSIKTESGSKGGKIFLLNGVLLLNFLKNIT